MPPKTPVTCNWVKSIVTDSTLDDFVKTGYLPKKEVMSYRAPDPTEEKPQPKEGEVSSGLPNTPRKRRNEVTSDLNSFYPLAGLTRQPLNSSDSNFQGTSPSSGESMQSNLPAFKTAPG